LAGSGKANGVVTKSGVGFDPCGAI